MLFRFIKKFFFHPKKPLIIAHRGASGTEPENTLRAFKAAHKAGADGIELDVMHSRDGKVVVTHDANAQRLAGVNKDVIKLNYAELSRLDFGKGERIPLLEEVLDHFLSKFSVINIEIKPTLFSGGIESHVAELIKKFKCEKKIVVSSFFPVHIRRVKALVPNVRVGYLLSASQGFVIKHKLAMQWSKPDQLHLDYKLFNKPTDKRAFELPKPKWVWTVNDDDLMRFWVAQPVEALITNFPENLVRIRNAQ